MKFIIKTTNQDVWMPNKRSLTTLLINFVTPSFIFICYTPALKAQPLSKFVPMGHGKQSLTTQITLQNNHSESTPNWLPVILACTKTSKFIPLFLHNMATWKNECQYRDLVLFSCGSMYHKGGHLRKKQIAKRRVFHKALNLLLPLLLNITLYLCYSVSDE